MPIPVNRLLSAVILLVVIAAPVCTAQMQEIIVTATRTDKPLLQTAAAATIISGDLVQSGQPQLGLDESLNRVPGLFLQNRYNFAQDLRVSIRGFGARANFGIRGIRIIVDGIPETLADGQGSVDSIDLSSIERIEVLRGASSSLYGNAAGGVIQIQSQLGGDVPALDLRVGVGEFGYSKQQLKLTGSTPRLDYLVSVADLDVDGYRDHSQAQNTLLNARGRYQLGERSTLTVAVASTDQPLANDAGGITREQAITNPRSARDRNVQLGAGEALTQTRIGWSFVHAWNTPARDRIELSNYYSWRDFAGFIPVSDGAIDIDRLFAGAGILYRTQRSTGATVHALAGGIDYDYQDDNRQRFENIDGVRGSRLLNQNERVTSLGLFVQDDIELGARSALTLGVRYDKVRFALTDRFLSNGNASGTRTLDALSPMIGFNFQSGNNLNLYANVSSSFETPTTTELARISGGFNPDLQPQLALTYEAGMRGSAGWFDTGYEFALFYIDVKDELVPFEQADGSALFVNAGESSRRGLEAAWHAGLTEHLTIGAAYTFTDFEFERFSDANGANFAGNAIPGIPDHLLQLNLDYKNAAGVFAGLEARYVGDIPLNNANTQFATSYIVVNARGGLAKQLANWTITPFVGIANLNDKRYYSNTRINAFGGRYFEPGPERNVYGGVSIVYQFKR